MRAPVLLPMVWSAAALVAAMGLALAANPARAQSATPFDGLRKTVSVELFQATEATGGAVTAEGMTSMLTNALAADGRFVVVERPGLAGLQAEQMLGQAGMTTGETAARAGQLIGASALVRGVVTKYEAAASGGGLSISGMPMGLGSLFGAGAGLKSHTGMMEIGLRLIDTSTGQVISTSVAQGSASTTQVDAGLVNPNTGVVVGAGAFQRTPIGQAGEQAIVKAVELIAAGMRNVPWSALVIDSANGVVYVNAGADRNMRTGTVLHVYRKGKVLTDPSTGVVLDVNLDRTGQIRIVSVRDRLSTAVLESGETPERGNLLKLD